MLFCSLALFTLVHLQARAETRARALDEATLHRVKHFRAQERLAADQVLHESRVRLHRDSDNPHDTRAPFIRTRKSVLLISGLFNSPKAMQALEESFFSRGYNVMNLRLAGHYDKDTSILCEHIQWSTWREQSREAFDLARALSTESVVLAGHSTGALLVTWLAVDQPRDVAGLALFAPAFKVSAALEYLLDSKAQIHFKTMRGRTMTLHAGRQVRDLGSAFAAAMGADCASGLAHVGRSLADVPVWMGNSGFDSVIDLAAANAFFDAVETTGRAPRYRKTLALTNFIVHDTLVSGTHWRWRALHDSMIRTLFPE